MELEGHLSETIVNLFGYNFSKVGGPTNPSVCTKRKYEVHDLIHEDAGETHE